MISLDASTLADALRRVKPAVSPRAQLPVLSGVHLHANGGVLDVTATNLDLTITTSMPCTRGDLDVVVPAATFSDFVSRAKDALKIDVKDGELFVEAPNARLELRLLSRDDWPKLPEVIGEPTTLPVEALALLRRIVHAAAAGKDAETRPVLGGMFIDGDVAVCTDSYRLATVVLPVALPDPLLLPAVSVNVILREADGPLELVANDRQVKVTSLDCAWTFRLVEGAFPAHWQGLFPTPIETLDVDREELLDALSGVASMNGHVRFSADGDSLHIEAQDGEVGRSERTLDAVSVPTFAIGFDAPLLADALSALTTERAQVLMVDAYKPVVAIDGELRVLVMPKKLRV